MSLLQCAKCGCVDNTATSMQGFSIMPECFDWTGLEEYRDKRLCSACGPARYADGKPNGFGVWHNKFKRTFLPIGMFRTARNGNLEHIETGEQDYFKYEICTPNTDKIQ